MSQLLRVKSSLALLFNRGNTAKGKVTYSRPSTATRTNKFRKNEEVAIDTPRIDYDLVTGELLGLLIEEQRTNLLVDSQIVEANVTGLWGDDGSASRTTNLIAPNGKAQAVKYVPTTNDFILRYDRSGLNANTDHTFSVYLRSDVPLSVRIGVSRNNFTDLTSATVSVTTDWQRFSVTGQHGSSTMRVSIGGSGSLNSNNSDQVEVWGAMLEEGSEMTSYIPTRPTFTSRASTKTYVDSTGTLQTAQVDEEVTDHYVDIDGVLVNAGQLLEDASTNRVPNSENFSVADWLKINSTPSTDVTTAPDGTTTADKLVVNNGLGAGVFQETLGTLSAQQYTVSFFAKASEFNTCYFRYSNSQEIRIDFDLVAKTATKNVANSTFDPDFMGVEEYGNGWFRCWITFTTSASRAFDYRIGTSNTGNGSDGIFFWGAMLEDGRLSSYIPTSGGTTTRTADVYSTATKTRSADVVSMSGQTFEDVFNNESYSILMEIIPNEKTTGNKKALELSDGTVANRVFFDSPERQFAIIQDGVTQVNIDDATDSTKGVRTKYGVKVSEGECKFFVDGAEVGTDTDFTIPIVDQMLIGSTIASSDQYLNGHVSYLVMYPIALEDQTLIDLTT